MPFTGTVNNPSGVNGAQMFEHESAYGEVKRMEQSVQAAPIAPAPAVSAPKRAQRSAVNRATQQASAPQTPADYQAALAQEWIKLASLPGASPLIQEIAARAAQQVNLGSR